MDFHCRYVKRELNGIMGKVAKPKIDQADEEESKKKNILHCWKALFTELIIHIHLGCLGGFFRRLSEFLTSKNQQVL